MIDTKRLATDAAYWQECGAPGDATHYEPGEQDPECWAKIVGDRIMHWSPVEEWHVWNPKGMDGRFIPRPQAQEAEWVDGLPPEGEICEAYDHAEGSWVSGKLLMHGNSDHAFASGSPEGWKKLFWACKFRPIPTKAQRDRDELARLIDEHQELSGSFVTPENTADAIIAAGWTKP